MDALIAYHEPGVAGSESLLAPLAAHLYGMGFDFKLMPLGEAIEACRGLGARRVYLLMFARGGHWASLRDACGVEPRVIPAWVSGRAIAEAAGAYGGRVMLLYWRARRLNELYTADIMRLAAHLKGMGFQVYTVESSMVRRFEAPRVDVIIPLSLLPGRLVERAAEAARLYGGVALPAFASYGLEALSSWLAWELLESRGL